MSTPAGRGIRVAMGLALAAVAIGVGGPGGWALGAFSLLPLVTGAADICPVCPLLDDTRRAQAGCTGSTCS